MPGYNIHILGWLSTGCCWPNTGSLVVEVVVLILGFQLRRVILAWLVNIKMQRLEKSLLSRFTCSRRNLFVAKALTWYGINFILSFEIVNKFVKSVGISLSIQDIFCTGIFCKVLGPTWISLENRLECVLIIEAHFISIHVK